MRSNKHIFIGVIVIAVVVGYLLVTFWPKPETLDREQVAKQAFMSTCNEDSKMLNYCNCMWSKLRDKYSIDTIAEMGKNGSYTQQLVDDVTWCIKLNPKEL